MLARFRRFLAVRAMRRRIAALSADERRRIIAASPLDAAAFQGEGYHVFRKDVADMNAAYVTSLGEVDPRAAEDWIIARYLEDETEAASRGSGRP